MHNQKDNMEVSPVSQCMGDANLVVLQQATF